MPKKKKKRVPQKKNKETSFVTCELQLRLLKIYLQNKVDSGKLLVKGELEARIQAVVKDVNRSKLSESELASIDSLVEMLNEKFGANKAPVPFNALR